MSEVMEQAVLRMPPSTWAETPLDRTQRHERYVAAADELLRLRAEVAALRADAERYRWLRAHLSPGTLGDHDVTDPASWDAAIDAQRVVG